MDRVKYRQIKKNNLQKFMERMGFINKWWFQQDNGPKQSN